MKFGLTVPQFGDFGDVRKLASLAKDAELAGWDGFFVWDHILLDPRAQPMVDPWIALTAIALNTESIKIGTMVTPVARRRPWKLARETATLDNLCRGRLVLGVGLGEPSKWEFGVYGEDEDPRARANRLDEGLDVLAGLWTGRPFSYQGDIYSVDEITFQPTPVQKPRIPVWVAGGWPAKRPFRRAARWDGVFPQRSGALDARPLTPDEIKDIVSFVKAHRPDNGPFDVITAGVTTGLDHREDTAKVVPFAAAGATWWLEDVSPFAAGWNFDGPTHGDQLVARVRRGPPRL